MARFTPGRSRRRFLAGSFLAAQVLLGLLPLRPLQAAPAFVQAAANEVTSGTSNSRAFTSANTADNLIGSLRGLVQFQRGHVVRQQGKLVYQRWSSNEVERQYLERPGFLR